jgi:hypothetical protein
MIAVVASLYGISLALTSLALLCAGLLAPGSVLLEVVSITAANAVAAIFRFTVLRAWVFRPGAIPTTGAALEASR